MKGPLIPIYFLFLPLFLAGSVVQNIFTKPRKVINWLFFSGPHLEIFLPAALGLFLHKNFNWPIWLVIYLFCFFYIVFISNPLDLSDAPDDLVEDIVDASIERNTSEWDSFHHRAAHFHLQQLSDEDRRKWLEQNMESIKKRKKELGNVLTGKDIKDPKRIHLKELSNYFHHPLDLYALQDVYIQQLPQDEMDKVKDMAKLKLTEWRRNN